MPTIKESPELFMLDALLHEKEGHDPSQAVIDQERRGQMKLSYMSKLPRKSHTPGIKDSLSQYRQMGIDVSEDKHDELFFDANLPDGWSIERTDHYLWSHLVDNFGHKRARIFYKAAFYDRDAFVSFLNRYTIHVIPTNDSSDYEVYKRSPLVGVVQDQGEVIYRTDEVDFIEKYGVSAELNTPDYWRVKEETQEELRHQLEAYMEEHFPDYMDVNAYWNN